MQSRFQATILVDDQLWSSFLRALSLTCDQALFFFRRESRRSAGRRTEFCRFSSGGGGGGGGGGGEGGAGLTAGYMLPLDLSAELTLTL